MRSALTLSGTLWCDGGLSNLYLLTFNFKFTFLFMERKVQEIHAYLNGNKKEERLFGADF